MIRKKSESKPAPKPKPAPIGGGVNASGGFSSTTNQILINPNAAATSATIQSTIPPSPRYEDIQTFEEKKDYIKNNRGFGDEPFGILIAEQLNRIGDLLEIMVASQQEEVFAKMATKPNNHSRKSAIDGDYCSCGFDGWPCEREVA